MKHFLPSFRSVFRAGVLFVHSIARSLVRSFVRSLSDHLRNISVDVVVWVRPPRLFPQVLFLQVDVDAVGARGDVDVHVVRLGERGLRVHHAAEPGGQGRERRPVFGLGVPAHIQNEKPDDRNRICL